MTQDIPRLIHQTYATETLPRSLDEAATALRAGNPDWTYTLYDDAMALDFIRTQYPARILAAFLAIDPRYGAARADLFRYLLLYRLGGVYLDVKSTCTRPLDAIIGADDRFLLCQWRNQPGAAHAGWGQWRDLDEVPGGEFQQWHIICAPGHPFLLAVIDRVLANIAAYRSWRDDVGRGGVLKLTGPIAYTKAIAPIRDQHAHRLVRGEDTLGLVYASVPNHTRIGSRHYATLSDPVVRPALRHLVAAKAWQALYVTRRARRARRDARLVP